MQTKEIYIYGIMPDFKSDDMSGLLENTEIYAIPFQDIAAIVSETNILAIDYSDRESLGHLLVRHQKTIEELMGIGFNMIIPMKLGTIVNSTEKVLKILSNGYNLIRDTFLKAENLIEIDLVATWADFQNTLNEIALHPDIVAIKDDFRNKSDLLTRADQMKVGILVQDKLKAKNTTVELDIMEAMTVICVDIKTHEVMNDQMITNSAFLIKRSHQETFEQLIDELDEKYKGLLNFKLVGPLPCYSFYTLEIDELNPGNVEKARIVLGLKEKTTESDIKKAYLTKARLFHPDTNMGIIDNKKFNRVNNAYHTLLDYAGLACQSTEVHVISLAKEDVSENLFVVKLRE